MRRLVTRSLLLIVVIAAALLAPSACGHVRAAGLVVRAAGMHGWWEEPIANFETVGYQTEDTAIQVRAGRIRARIYHPATIRTRTVLLTGGVHAKGIDEPRLTKFAMDLARGGTPVVTAEVPDLLRYRISPAETDTIEDAAVWVAAQPALAPDGRIGLYGISFAGGLSIAAAGRPRLRDHVSAVLSFGGHGNLTRVARYLCTGELPDHTVHKPHDYGVVVMLINLADQVVPPEQVEPLRQVLVSFMTASHLDMVDKAAAAKEFERARELTQTLPEPARTYMGYVNDRNVPALGAVLLPHVALFENDPALSPEIAPGITAPVFLIHGSDDNVVPASESRLLAERLQGQVPVHLLITPLITHAEVDRDAGVVDIWRLIRFWYALLSS